MRKGGSLGRPFVFAGFLTLCDGIQHLFSRTATFLGLAPAIDDQAAFLAHGAAFRRVS
jgi:hypothetical protein